MRPRRVIQRQHQPRLRNRAAMVDRPHAETAVPACPAARCSRSATGNSGFQISDPYPNTHNGSCILWPSGGPVCKHGSGQRKGARMRKLLAAVIVAAGLWTGYWWAGAWAIEKAINQVFAAQAEQGRVALNTGVAVHGIPNRFDLRVDQIELADPACGLGLENPFPASLCDDMEALAHSGRPAHRANRGRGGPKHQRRIRSRSRPRCAPAPALTCRWTKSSSRRTISP